MQRVRSAISLVVGFSATLALNGCGIPETPDIRSEMSDAVAKLGVRPVFPPTETLRLGTILLVDASVARPFSGLAAHQETSLRITSDLEAAFEAARRKQFSAQAANRLPQSSSTLVSELRPTTTGSAFYRQTVAKPNGGGEVPPHALPLAAMPGYKLASVDQLSFGAFLPDLLASFFASIGFRRTSYLRIEAEGIEVAELPLADVMSTLDESCRSRAIRTREPLYSRAVSLGYDIFESQRKARGAKEAVLPRLMLLRKVFYMRGVRFITEDSTVTAAMVDAAIKNPVPAGASAVALPTITVNSNPPAPDPAAGVGTPANTAAIAALQQQITQLRSALATGNNTQLSGSFARAAATGVELVQLFDRPLAFGYQALTVPAGIKSDDVSTTSKGWSPLCELVGVTP